MSKIPELAAFSTFRMGGMPRDFVSARSKEELVCALARFNEAELPVWILGGGSNTVFTSETFPFAVVHMCILGKEVLTETEDFVSLRVAAGENWDELVSYTAARGWSGLELLSAIPGTVGAAPMQNIGAYGVEFADCAESVEVYDRKSGEFVLLPAEQCGFGYRTSVFKTTERGRYVITAVVLRLSKAAPKLPANAEVAASLKGQEITPETIRAAVRAIRARKLEDPATVANVGSFFENPIIKKEQAEALRAKHPTAPLFPVSGSENFKASAGWLLEQLGYKGKVLGHFQFSSKHALVLTHLGGGTARELEAVISQVQTHVRETFGITLRPEPEVVV